MTLPLDMNKTSGPWAGIQVDSFDGVNPQWVRPVPKTSTGNAAKTFIRDLTMYRCELGNIGTPDIRQFTALVSERVSDDAVYAWIEDRSKALVMMVKLQGADPGCGDPNHDVEWHPEQSVFAALAGKLGTLTKDGKAIGYCIANSVATVFLLDVLNGTAKPPLVHENRMRPEDHQLVGLGRVVTVKSGYTLW